MVLCNAKHMLSLLLFWELCFMTLCKLAQYFVSVRCNMHYDGE
jgi:hypothetical protein